METRKGLQGDRSPCPVGTSKLPANCTLAPPGEGPGAVRPVLQGPAGGCVNSRGQQNRKIKPLGKRLYLFAWLEVDTHILYMD